MGSQSGSGKGSGSGYQVTGGGAGQPFNFGPSPFDLSSIQSAVGDNTQAVTNRYNQLGLGGPLPSSAPQVRSSGTPVPSGPVTPGIPEDTAFGTASTAPSGSTMEQQDLAAQNEIGLATIGQEQNTTVSDPAINTALQPSINSLIGVGSSASANQGLGSALSSLANQANSSGAFSSGASSISDSTLSDAALGSSILGG